MRVEGGYYVWNKGDTFPFPGGYFVSDEFACHCSSPACVEQRVAVALVEKLQAVRVALGRPVSVASGFRCQGHQAALAAAGRETARGTSQHELGRAADIAARPMGALVRELERHFKAIGVAPTWTHVDLRDDKERRWTYVR